MLRIGIVDDEPAVRDQLEGFIDRFCKENGVSIHCRNYENGEQLLKETDRDEILLLDIDLPGTDGMETARKLREEGCSSVILFVTNMAQYAIHGYEVNALDFMVKPIGYEVFRLKLQKALDAVKARQDVKLKLKTRDGFRQVYVSQILYVEVQRHKLFYHLEDEVLEAWDTIGHAREMLEPQGFALCNVCYLVNLEHVVSMKEGMVQVGKDLLKISRGKKKKFEDALTSSFR